EAWRSLDQLRDATRFDAWLDGICRNVCRRHDRESRQQALYQAPPVHKLESSHAEEASADSLFQMADPQALDPLEALTRQDLLALLDRALSYLPPQTRRALEYCYLAEMPQQEAAARLGISGNALGVRLHRARRQLEEVLSTQLRVEAEEFGLLPGGVDNAGWRETRMWCNYCGHHRLRGKMEPQPDGYLRVRLRCTACWSRYGVDHLDAHVDTAKTPVSSFLPACKRAIHSLGELHATAIANGYVLTCPKCQRESTRLRIVRADELPRATFSDLIYFTYDCPACGPSMSSISVVFWLLPAAWRFVAEHPHYLLEPDVCVEYVGQPTFRFRMTDASSSARLTTFAHAETLDILATFQE
ncbi:MAG TPA: sigma-70 family RNA polymerase sigma factor, partial [Ktedonobacterales bacterium]|nr:sigma-70 family RNA polymerase sigma factor [Ktedonobacterales bacterium]